MKFKEINSSLKISKIESVYEGVSLIRIINDSKMVENLNLTKNMIQNSNATLIELKNNVEKDQLITAIINELRNNFINISYKINNTNSNEIELTYDFKSSSSKQDYDTVINDALLMTSKLNKLKRFDNVIINSNKNNILFSKNTANIVDEIFNNAPKLRTKNLSGNKEKTEILNYLEKNQFILLTKKRPKKGIILKHQLFENIKQLYHTKTKIITTKYQSLIEDVNKIKGNSVNLFDDNVFEFLSGSAQLEGSTVTIGETKELLVNDIYPNKPKKDIRMVKNLNEAMHHVLENIDEDINEEQIKEINKIVLFSMHRNSGKYKITQNKIQGNPEFKTTPPEKVRIEMQKLCNEIRQIKTKKECLNKIGYIHNELQHIHPFSDGNSRTTRMIINWILLKYNIPILVLKMGCFDEYMSLTKLSKSRNDKKLTQLMHHILVHENLIN
jgi:fido (protein-threonine AMPylation protein)